MFLGTLGRITFPRFPFGTLHNGNVFGRRVICNRTASYAVLRSTGRGSDQFKRGGSARELMAKRPEMWLEHVSGTESFAFRGWERES